MKVITGTIIGKEIIEIKTKDIFVYYISIADPSVEGVKVEKAYSQKEYEINDEIYLIIVREKVGEKTFIKYKIIEV